MILVEHRRNTLQQLKMTPRTRGVEVDIRSFAGRLIVHHDPFVDSLAFDEWLAEYDHRLLILNVKEEGLEDPLLERMQSSAIEEFFFLDQSFPFLVKTAMAGEGRCAVRVSEFESVDTALSLAGKVEWAWVDCFTCFPLDAQEAAMLKQAGFKLCLVSPELQGRTDEREIVLLRELLRERNISPDAVCTKRPDLWS